MAITISGENNNDRILAADGVIDQVSGINFSGIITASHINVGSNIQLGNAGIITATTFVGNVTGNVNSTSPLLLQTGGSERFRITGNNELGIAGANYGTSGQVLTSGGSGSAVSWTTIPTQVTISNNADNRVITGGSGTNLNGEANLTFSGSTLKVNSTTGHSYLKLNSNDSYSGTIHFGDQSDDDAAQIWYDNYQGNGMYFRTSENTPMSFYTNSSPRLRIKSTGEIGINTTSPGRMMHIFSGSTGHPLILERGDGSNTQIEIKAAGVTRGYWGSSSTANFMVYDNDTSDIHFVVNQTGQLGVGTVTPDQTLEVFKASGTNLVKVTSQANSTVGLEIEKTGATTQSWRIADGQTVNGALEFYDVTDSRRVMGIDGSGRIIIGPGSHAGGSQLVIKGGGTNTYSTLGMFSNHTNPSDNTLLSQIRFGSNATAVGADIRVYADADWGSSNDYPTRMEFYTTPDGSNSRQVRLAIDKDGKIHTGNPASLAIDDFNITATGTGATLSLNRAATGNASDNDLLGAVSFQSYPAGQGYAAAEAAIRSYAETGQSGSAAPTNLIFYTKPSTTGPGASPDERLRITSDGKIGINEGTPEAALHIQTESGNNRAFQVGTITGQNRYLVINHFNGQQNFHSMKMRVNDNGLIAMLDLGNPYGSTGHGTQIKFSGYQDNECGAIQLVNTANSNASAVDMVFRTGGTSEKLRITSGGILKTSNVSDSVFKFQIDDSIGWWNTNTGLAPNSTRTWTITNVNYGGCKILIGGGDGNYQRAGAIIDVVGTMWANNKSYYHYETIKNSSGASISTTYNNSSIVISVTAGSNWWYYSMSIESHRRSSGANFPTVTVS